MGFIDRGLVAPTLNDNSAAGANTVLIQAALDAAGRVEIVGSGIIWINDTLKVRSDTDLSIDPRITMKLAAGVNKPMIVNKAWADGLWSDITITWPTVIPPSLAYPNPTATSSQIALVNWPNHGLSVGDAEWTKGTAGATDSAFTGVFQIIGVKDANSFWVSLKRLPGASPSGTIKAQKSDQRIKLRGGNIWDINVPGNPGAGSNQALFLSRQPSIFCNVYDFEAYNWRNKNCFGFGLLLGAMSKYRVRSSNGMQNTGNENWNQDNIKLMGPLFDGEVQDIFGDSGDDQVSFEPWASGFPNTDITGGGDILSLRIKNVRSERSTQGIVVGYMSDKFVTDDVIIDGVSGWSSPEESGSASALVRIISEYDPSNTLIGTFDRIEVRNVLYMDDASPAHKAVQVTGKVTGKLFVVDAVENPTSAGTISGANLCTIDASATMDHVVVRGWRVNWLRSNVFGLNIFGPCRKVTMRDCVFRSNIGGNGRGVFLSSPGTRQVLIDNCEFYDVVPIEVGSGANDTPTVILTNLDVDGPDLAIFNASARVSFGNCKAASMGSGAFRLNGSSGLRVIASNLGGNVKPSGASWLTRVGGSENFQMFNGFDIDLDVTQLERADGQIVRNNNAAAGTLASAGVALCHGTAAGSWKLLADTTKTY